MPKEEQVLKNLTMENANEENEKKDEKSKMLIKESLWPSLWELVNIVYLEEIADGSVLGSPFYIIDGT